MFLRQGREFKGIVPALVVSAFGGTLSGRLTDLFSPHLLIIVSLGLLVLVFNDFSTVTPVTTVGMIVAYMIAYRLCLFAIKTPLTSLNVTILDHDQVRMGQGLVGLVAILARPWVLPLAV
jgi:hypothetical protein